MRTGTSVRETDTSLANYSASSGHEHIAVCHLKRHHGDANQGVLKEEERGMQIYSGQR